MLLRLGYAVALSSRRSIAMGVKVSEDLNIRETEEDGKKGDSRRHKAGGYAHGVERRFPSKEVAVAAGKRRPGNNSDPRSTL